MACQHSQQTRDVDPMLVQFRAHRVRRWPSIKPALRAADLAVHTAGGESKPIPTQCLLNVGPALPVLASIHSVLSVLHAGGIDTML